MSVRPSLAIVGQKPEQKELCQTLSPTSSLKRPLENKRVVRLIALNIDDRDLSIGLVMLKDYAMASADVAERYDIRIHQWQKNYARIGVSGTIDGLDIEHIVSRLEPETTSLFGFSMYTWNHSFMLEVARRLKDRNPKAKMLFGGSQAGGYGARLLAEYPFVDYVIRGEAEFAFRDFLLREHEGDLSQTPNLFYRGSRDIESTISADPRVAKRASYLPTIADLPLPYKNAEYRAYLDGLESKVTAQFETERGCPLSCAFCSWGTRLPIRRRSQKDVEEGLTYLLEHPNVRAVYIVDANPFIKDEKGLWLTEFLLNKNKTGKPVFFELNPEYIRDERVIENLGKLQGDELAFGLQSTSDVTLKKIKRRFHRDVYERNVRRLRQMNPKANIKFSLIIGLPGDTYQSFLDSLDFAIGMIPNDMYVHDLLILPGSEMYDDPASFGIQIDRSPPHRLLANETFPMNDYNRAKHLGFYVKLLHRYPQIRDGMLVLAKKLGRRTTELYSDFIEHLLDDGVDALSGDNISSVSTEEFDYRTKTFLDVVRNRKALEESFSVFARKQRAEIRSQQVAIQAAS